jgi:hypothetical protein
MRHNARATFFGEKIQMAKVVVVRVNPPAVQPASFANRPVPRQSSTQGFRPRNEYLLRTWRLKPFSRSRRGHTAARPVETRASATRPMDDDLVWLRRFSFRPRTSNSISPPRVRALPERRISETNRNARCSDICWDLVINSAPNFLRYQPWGLGNGPLVPV